MAGCSVNLCCPLRLHYMRIPIIRGVIERRVLVNYRVEREVLPKLLPTPFRPKVVCGYGLVGICLIRLERLRPRSFPACVGLSSENAAHRAAVEWDDNGMMREGVFIWRRDTDSRLTACGGGWLFPGIHHQASFHVNDSAERIEIELESNDRVMGVTVRGRPTSHWPTGSVFTSLAECSAFFEAGSLGYSPTRRSKQYQGLELRSHNWQARPLAIEEVRSSFFDDADLFPRGSLKFDNALLMRDIEHEWHGKADLCCAQSVGQAPPDNL